MKPSTQYLYVSIACALNAFNFIGAAIWIKQSGAFSNGYQTFFITGPKDSAMVLLIFCALGFVAYTTISGIVTKTEKMVKEANETNELATN